MAKIELDLAMLDRIVSERRFEPRTVDIARRLFLQGESARRLASEYGLNVQRIYAIRREILDAVNAKALPAGWEEVTFSAPRPVIEMLKLRLEQELARYDVGRRTTPDD